MNEHLSHSTAVTLTPRRAGLRATGDNTVEVLLRVQAPDAPPGQTGERPPQAVALVIDRSGSMQGRPIAEARRCADYVISTLRPRDTVSLVQFDKRVQRLWPAIPLRDASAVRGVIAGIHAGGNTNLFGGWREGVDTLADAPGTGLKRVILLSDGQANEGETDMPTIASQCAVWAFRGITTSTYGLGDVFNEDLMVAMARAGGGNHYYGDTADDLMEPFQQELELLGNLCLRDLRVTATAPDGVGVQIVNDLPRAEGAWRLPDLAWGAEAWAVLRLTVPDTTLPAVGDLLPLLRISVQGLSLDGEAVQREFAALALPVLNQAAFDLLADDELVTRRSVELAAAGALTQMHAAAAEGDWVAVDRLLETASGQFAGHAWVGAMLDAMKTIADSRLRERMMKESMYSSSKLRSRLAAKEEPIAFSAGDDAAQQPSYLRRKPAQGKTGE
ncbi:MAG: VWA domain-containing protein [Hydrogenophaga sp.]|uniref:vWA domain-containing protein n=1 Tax=Hydrogenophaga sp. TaxID=1904254 RepID=UPI002627E8E3|nr:VWA domain-containing protein [Hydrogenophaga sp.]MDM7943550.1 VWA domain-containing protein [Hydrogenophaga sp.]